MKVRPLLVEGRDGELVMVVRSNEVLPPTEGDNGEEGSMVSLLCLLNNSRGGSGGGGGRGDDGRDEDKGLTEVVPLLGKVNSGGGGAEPTCRFEEDGDEDLGGSMSMTKLLDICVTAENLSRAGRGGEGRKEESMETISGCDTFASAGNKDEASASWID